MTKILVVEDNPAIVDFYRDLFDDAGYEMRSAEDAVTAVPRHREFGSDLIILDLNIPAGGGMSVFQTLRERLNDPVPIIFVTGMPEHMPNMANLHNVKVLTKPVAPEVLLGEIRRFLPAPAPAAQAFNPPPPPPRQARKKVLVVDDDPGIIAIYGEILAKAGYEVGTAEDALGAVTRFQDFKPDLVVLDVDMPGGGGTKVFERLRSQLASPVPIVFSTGVPEKVAPLARNMKVAVLKKPLSPEDLLGAVKALLAA